MEEQLILDLKSGKDEVLDQLYARYRKEFVHWAMRHFSCGEEDAIDTFQDVMISFYENIMSGKLTRFDSKIKTYLFAIGKNKLINKLKRDSRIDADIEGVKHKLDESGFSDGPLAHSEKVEVVADLLAGIGAPCERLLTLFYYQRFSMESIADNMAYKSADVAKAQKNRCIKKLRTLLHQQYQVEDFN